MAEPSAHHDQLHAGRDQPRRRRNEQSSVHLQQQIEPGGNWENVILQAAQTWAQETNINFAVVPDDGAAAGSGADEEGNPGFGDIRIGGYNFGSSTLALTYQPPSANNFSIAGNMTFNTGQSFNVGSTYDLSPWPCTSSATRWG